MWFGHQAIQIASLVKIMDTKNPDWPFGVFVGTSSAVWQGVWLDPVSLNTFMSWMEICRMTS